VRKVALAIKGDNIMTITYESYLKKSAKEYNELPIFWAFSNKQLEEQMGKRGLKLADTDKICRVSNGGFCLKSDLQKIKDFFNKPDPLRDLMKDPNFAVSAFYYEMQNHEYHINWQADWDVCNCFGKCEYSDAKDYTDYLKEMGYSSEIIKSYTKARRKFLKDADANDWY
jgi:hypothetical protein